jgi:3-hydroxybutyryl-CoA dehydrogenase
VAEVQKIAVIGAGTMGAGIAQVAALSYFDVRLFDARAEAVQAALLKAKSQIEKDVLKLGMSGADVAQAFTRLRGASSLEEAVSDADLVVEAVPEQLDLKRLLFKEISERTPAHAVLASNTSSLSVSELARGSKDPSRVIGMHFFNPPMVLKLLELVRAEQTSEETVAVAHRVGERMGREIISVKDSPGFATSRLGVVLALEAMRMLESGVASAEDIDRAMEHGYKHQMGPLRTTDLVGLDVRLAIAEHLHRSLGGAQYAPPEILQRLVKEGKLGKKTKQGFYSW